MKFLANNYKANQMIPIKELTDLIAVNITFNPLNPNLISFQMFCGLRALLTTAGQKGPREVSDNYTPSEIRYKKPLVLYL
jgi:hypothetical protein